MPIQLRFRRILYARASDIDETMRARTTAWGLGVLCLAVCIEANALRCGTRLISEGDHVSRLLHYCGEPYTVETRTAQRGAVANVGGVVFPGFYEEIVIEQWTYNFGPRRLMRQVRVENGFVAEIRRLGYGFLEE